MMRKRDIVAEKLALALIAGGGSYSEPYVNIMAKDGSVFTVNIVAALDAFRALLKEKP